MELANCRDSRFFKTEASPSRNLDLVHFSVALDINQQVYCCFYFGAGRSLCVVGSKANKWPRQAKTVLLGAFFGVWRQFDTYAAYWIERTRKEFVFNRPINGNLDFRKRKSRFTNELLITQSNN